MKFYRVLYYVLLFLIMSFCFYCMFSIATTSDTGFDVIYLVMAALYISAIVIFSHFSPMLLAKAGKLVQVTEGILYKTVINAFSCINVDKSKINLYIKPKSKIKKKIANAGVQGYFNHTIIIYQDALDLLNQDEISALIFHEVAHAKTKDDFKRTFALLSIVLLPSTIFVFVKYLNLINPLISSISIFLLICFFIGIFYLFYSFRKQEYKADMFAAEKYNSKSVINTLYRLSEINNERTKLKLIRQLLSTHPDVKSRINKINNKFC